MMMTEEERRDAAKIAARRQRENDRVQRLIHDPFNRQVGQDYQALREQIREREEARQLQANQEQEEIEQQRRIAEMVNAMDMERQEEEARKKEQLRASWKLAAAAKAEEREKQARREKMDTERSGWQLAGEDPYAAERKKMQALQMERWCAQQMTLKEYEAEKAAKAEAKYLEQLAQQDARRERVEAERAEQAKQTQAQVREANLIAAQQRRELASRERRRALRGAGAASMDDFLTTSQSTNEFKGLTPEQKERIKAENARRAAEAVARKQRERQEAEEHGRLLQMQATYAQRAKMEDDEARRRERQQHLAILEQQAMEQRARAEAEKRRTQQPTVTGGFFEGFGRSSR